MLIHCGHAGPLGVATMVLTLAPVGQDESSRRGFLVDEMRRSAVDVGTATVSMPQRVQRMNTTISRLEAGTLKPRVRVLESERADRRNGLLQVGSCERGCASGPLVPYRKCLPGQDRATH